MIGLECLLSYLTVAFHGGDLQIPAEVASVQATDGKAISVAGHSEHCVGYPEIRVLVQRVLRCAV